MDNPVNISDADTLIFWCWIDFHKNILVLTRVYSFIYARVRSCCSVVWRPSALEDEDEDCTTIIILYCTICSAAVYCYDYWMYNQCITLIVFILLYIIISNVYFNSFMNCYLLLYVIVPLRDSVLFCSVLFGFFISFPSLFFFILSILFFFFLFSFSSFFLLITILLWTVRVWHVWFIVDSKCPEAGSLQLVSELWFSEYLNL